MRIYKNKLILLFLLIPLIIAGCGDDKEGASKGGRPSYGGRNNAPTDVVTSTVKISDFKDTFTALGTARAKGSIDITSRSTNIIKEILFKEGELVEKNTLLVTLDNRELTAELAIRNASLDELRSQYRRLESLSKNQAITESELEERASQVKIAEAQLAVTQAKLDDTYIKAPFRGRLGLRAVSIGSLVQSTTQITTLDDTSIIKAIFAVPESFLSTIDIGQFVSIKSSIFETKIFEGRIKTINSRVDDATRNIFIVAEINNSKNLLKPGMFLTVNIDRERKNSILIPEESLAPRLGIQYVFVIEDNKAKEVKVKLGSRITGSIEILDGLKEGDVIVTEGIQKLRSGQPVKITTVEQLKVKNNVDF